MRKVAKNLARTSAVASKASIALASTKVHSTSKAVVVDFHCRHLGSKCFVSEKKRPFLDQLI